MKGTVYAYMADQKPSTASDTLVWARYLGEPQEERNRISTRAATDDPWWGILGTPVIDRASSSLYVVAWNDDGQYRLYNLDLNSGNVKQGPVIIQGVVAGRNFVENRKGWKQVRKQRAALLLANGALYVAFGGDNPEGPAGWLFVYEAATLTLKTVWSPTPAGRNGGIWQGGQGPAADSEGNVYLQTGDGDFDPGRQLYGNSLLKLHLGNEDLTVADYFTPCNQLFLDRCDLDQGSSGPLLFNGFCGGRRQGRRALSHARRQTGQVLPRASTSEERCLQLDSDVPGWPTDGSEMESGQGAHSWITCVLGRSGRQKLAVRHGRRRSPQGLSLCERQI